MAEYKVPYLFWLATKLLLNKEDRALLYQAGILYMMGEIEDPVLSKRVMRFWPSVKKMVQKAAPF